MGGEGEDEGEWRSFGEASHHSSSSSLIAIAQVKSQQQGKNKGGGRKTPSPLPLLLSIYPGPGSGSGPRSCSMCAAIYALRCPVSRRIGESPANPSHTHCVFCECTLTHVHTTKLTKDTRAEQSRGAKRRRQQSADSTAGRQHTTHPHSPQHQHSRRETSRPTEYNGRRTEIFFERKRDA
jgi:hypothetical protein